MNLLTQPDFLSLCRGAVRLESRAAGLLLHRTTASQLAYLDGLGPGAGLRGRCNASQQIVLRTDAERLDVSLDVGTGARRCFGIAACVDGVCTHPAFAPSQPDGSTSFAVALRAPADQPRTRLVRLHLHPSRVVTLLKLDAIGATVVAPVPPAPRRLLCYGDSIMQGMEAISPLSPYPVPLAELLDADLLNLAIGGQVFDAAYIDPDLPFKPDLIAVAYGTNDWARGLSAAEIGRQTTAFLRRIAAIHPQARVAALTPLWSAGGHERKAAGTLPEASAAIAAAAAAETGVRVVDGLTLVPNEPRYFVDGLHPNDLGFGHYTTNLVRALRDWLPASP